MTECYDIQSNKDLKELLLQHSMMNKMKDKLKVEECIKSNCIEQQTKCNCVKCSISYHEAKIQGISDTNFIICKRCKLNITECFCCLRKFSCKQKINKMFEDKMYNIKNDVLVLSESTLEVFVLFEKLTEIVQELKTELSICSTNKINDVKTIFNNIEEDVGEVDKENYDIKTMNNENCSSKQINIKQNIGRTNSLVLVSEKRRFSVRSDISDFIGSYNNDNAKHKRFTIASAEERNRCVTKTKMDFSEVLNEKSYFERNSSVSNTLRIPNFKFEGNMLNRVKNMSLNKNSIVIKSLSLRKNQESISSNYLHGGTLKQLSLDSEIYSN